MTVAVAVDEELLHRLPLPLAQLYRRAHNAKTPQERHHTAYYLWEAALKLLGCVAIAEYAEFHEHAPELIDRLKNLARPSLGQWWEIVRLLLPVLADKGDRGFMAVRELLMGKMRDDLPHAAGLDGLLKEVLKGRDTSAARATVRPTELFDRLLSYRNREIGHGAVGQRSTAFYDRLGRALLAGVPEIIGRLDVLAARRLFYFADIRRQPSGRWLVERFELLGETPRRLESLELPDDEAARRLLPERLYLGQTGVQSAGDAHGESLRLVPLHPLMVYEADVGEALFLNVRRGRRRICYLSYSSGREVGRDQLLGEQRELLSRVLGMPVDAPSLADWEARLETEEKANGEIEDASAPRRLGEFELLSELGRGGMGVVYRAWQPSLRRQVAVKALYRSGDPKAEARFAREVRALGHVEHPHLVKIFTSGTDGDRWFYAMELVEGATLAAVCEKLHSNGSGPDTVDVQHWQKAVSTVCAEARESEKPVTDGPTAEPDTPREAAADATRERIESPIRMGQGYVRRAVQLICQVAEAAHALHEKGVLHRDIKPGNVIVTSDASQAVLMDLGLAQIADEVEGRLTKTRQFVGTLRYASPEQVLAVGGLDRRSDVYNLGATLWELLTLQPMFGATDQTPTPELMRRIQLEDPAGPRKYHARISRDLEAVVLKCLEKDPSRRYGTAQELAQDLERYLAGEPVKARPVGEVERLWRWCRRNSLVASLLAAVAAALVLGSATAIFFAIQAQKSAVKEKQRAQTEREARKIADQQRQRAQNEESEKERQLELARATLVTAQLLRVASLHERDPGLAFELLHDREVIPVERRDFAWGYFDRLSRRDPLVLQGHPKGVMAVAFSPDGKTLASASLDETIAFWDRSGEKRTVLKGHTGAVMCLAFSPDGKTLASGGNDQAVRLWDVASGKQRPPLTGHSAGILAVAFSSDGHWLASSGWDGTIRLWETATGRPGDVLRGHTAGVAAVAFSPDSKLLASASLDATIRLWEVSSGRLQKALAGHTGWIWSVAFAPDGKRLASGSLDQTVRVWDTATGQETASLRGHTDVVRSVAFSPNGRLLASGSADATVRLWDANTGQERAILTGHTDRVWSVAFSPDSNSLASGGWDRTVRVWDAGAGQRRPPLRGHTAEVASVAFSKDGASLFSGSWDRTIGIWDAVTGQERAALRGHTDGVVSVALSPDGRFLASGSHDHTIKLWDTAKGSEQSSLQGHTAGVWSVDFSPDGKSLASGSWDQTVRLWDVASGRERATLRGHTDWIWAVAFSADGKTLASASWDKTIRLWDAASGAERATLRGHTDGVVAVAFSPDGKTLASASNDQTVRLWDVLSGKNSAVLTGHTGGVLALAYSPDGRSLASGSWDQTVRLWDTATGQERAALRGHTAEVLSVAFRSDGRALASASADGTIRLWEAVAPKRR